MALVTLAAAAPAAAAPADATAGSTEPGIEVSADLPRKPRSYEIGPAEAIRIANRDPKVAETRERYGRLEASADTDPPATWEVGYFADDREVAQVLVDDPTASVREAWTGDQVAWQMARGYEGSFGHTLNAPYVWLPLSLLFLCGLFDWRRPWRIVHLDLLVLLGFGVSLFFFNRADIGVSVPLAYPVLVYLLARMIWVGFRRRGEGLNPTAPIAWLAIGAAFLLGFRIALNIADSGVIDVGYSGVVGADRIVHGEQLWGEGEFPDDNPFGDTYGPVNYYAYVPFELVLPWSGEWDELAAGHAAAIFFDLAAAALLFALGRRMRAGVAGRDLGVVLAFAWASFPFTDYALQSNANDSLVAALVLAALVLIGSPAGRGAMAAMAAMAKFAPLGLAPLLAAGPRAGLASRDPETGEGALAGARLRSLGIFVAALRGVGGLAMALPLVDPGAATFLDRTLAEQIDRDSPFSIWGQERGLADVRIGLIVAVAAFAVLVAFLPRRRTLPQIAALAAAVLIALQLTVEHWFYLYIVWFFGPAIAAIAAIGSEPPPERATPAKLAGVGDSKSVGGVSRSSER